MFVSFIKTFLFLFIIYIAVKVFRFFTSTTKHYKSEVKNKTAPSKPTISPEDIIEAHYEEIKTTKTDHPG